MDCFYNNYLIYILAILIVNGCVWLYYLRRRIKLKSLIKKATQDFSLANKRLTELDRSKSEFISIVSHQLRTPLTGLKGYLSMILEGDLGNVNSELKSTVENLLHGTSRMIRLVNTFLNASRVQMGKLTLDCTLTQLMDLINSIIAEFEPEIKKKGLEFKLKAPAIRLPKIKIDRDKIEDVLVNLIDNALKYTNKGQIQLDVKLNQKNIEVNVKDSGIGFTKKDSRRFFHKFARGNRPKLGIGGSGLGLFIVKKIIEAHHGRVFCHSNGVDTGATFSFTLPLKK